MEGSWYLERKEGCQQAEVIKSLAVGDSRRTGQLSAPEH